MKEVDARGLSCPEPLMMTADALKNEKGPVKVLVSEVNQKMNEKKYALPDEISSLGRAFFVLVFEKVFRLHLYFE